MAQPRRIVYCHCAFYDLVPKAAKDSILRLLASLGLAFDPVPDLCELAAHKDPMLKEIAEGGSAAIVACHERAVRWLFAAAGAPLPEKGVEILNLRTRGPAEVTDRLLEGAVCQSGSCACNAGLVRALLDPQAGQWIPWFPVIDYDRCTGCRQCLDFCLFGVFAVDERGRVVVEHPENCKPNCPACARVCPEVAIIFPKYASPPINGAKVTPEDEAADPVRVDLASLLGGDIHATLRKRSGAATDSGVRNPESGLAPPDCSCVANILKRLGINPEGDERSHAS
jgi:NAD-dependent dihydropyrimidine dehydrogenase PreA subunit